MQDAVDEVLDEGDVGRLVVVAVHAVGADHAGVRVPGHAGGDVEEEHGFQMVGAMEDAVGERVEGVATGLVDGVRDLRGVFVGFYLAIEVEDVGGGVE